jgi:hypothetical protein
MKYYSDVLDKFFDSEDECLAAEKENNIQFKKDALRAEKEAELKSLRKDVTRLRQELDCALEKFYAAQHEYFNDYNRLYPSVENESENEIPNECAGCEDYDNCDHEPVGKSINIYMKRLESLKENYPHLWDLFYGGH